MTTPILERVFRKVKKARNGCWLWNGADNDKGYGVILAEGPPRRMTYVHRAVYEATIGPIPEGLVLDHLCRTRRCCNPAHLEPVTQLINLERGESPNFRTRRTRICKRGHVLTPDNIVTPKDGRERCRECVRLRKRRYYHQQRVRLLK